jgi:hypothetical protein
MAYHDREVRKCKYCDEPAKRNIYIRKDTGKPRNKGFCKTCGSEKCKTEQYRDSAVTARKQTWRGKHKDCESCGESFEIASRSHKWYRTCVPTDFYRQFMQRYGLTATAYDNLFAGEPDCPICLKRKASVVDHCHSGGHVRGVLCNGCNMALSLLDTDGMLERAFEYIGRN